MKKILFLIALVLSILKSDAQTYVSGGIYANTTWTKAASPYIVTDTVFLFPGVVLTIEPGVTVNFKNNKVIESREASIIAEGNLKDSIIFICDDLFPSSQLYFNKGILNSEFAYCNFQNATTAILYHSFGVVTIRKSTFNSNNIGIKTGEATHFLSNGMFIIDSTDFINHKDYGINSYSSNTALLVSNSKFLHNKIGVNNKYTTTYADTFSSFYNCVFDSNQVGGILLATKLSNSHIGSNIIGVEGFVYDVNNCTIENNIETGLSLEGGLFISDTIHNSIVRNNGIGLHVSGCAIIDNLIEKNIVGIENSEVEFSYPKGQPASIINNVIKLNKIGIKDSVRYCLIMYNEIENDSIGIILTDTTSRITCNKICNNYINNFEYYGKLNTTIANNYWCTLDSSSTKLLIFDGYNIPTYGLAKFMPIDTSCYKTLGLKELKQHQQTTTKLYPNPFSNTATLVFENPQNNNHQFSVFNTMGQLVMSIENIKGTKVLIDRQELQNGLYFYQLRNEEGVIGSGKMMIE